MQSQEKEFDKQLEEIGNLYETMKDCYLAMRMGRIYTFQESLKKEQHFFTALQRMREIACMNLRAKHDIEEN